MALEGSIRDFSLADIFQLIGIQRKTGVLTLKTGEEEVKVSFLNGLVVNADAKSKRLDDRLGNVLVKTGKLSPDALKKALKTQKDTLKKIGTVLVDEKLVRNEDLREALGIQITQIIYRLFRWKDGQYHFEQDVSVDYDKENFTPMSAESILMEGMRMIDEWPIIERKITSFEMVFERVPLADGVEPQVEEAGVEEEAPSGKEDDFDLIFGKEKKQKDEEAASRRIKLTRDENIVYQQVDGAVSVQEIIERTMLSEFEICRALYDLMSRNLIAPVSAQVKGAAASDRKKRADTGRLAALAVYAVVLGGLIVAVPWQRANRLNLVTPRPLASAPVRALMAETAGLRVRRAAEAIDTYVLLHRKPPGALDDLLAEGLLDARDARDPWGEPLGFEVRPDRIVVSGRTSGADPQSGAPATERVTEERVFATDPARL